MRLFRIGFIVNPLAGAGGPLANKGSDNLCMADIIGADKTPNALARASQFLQGISTCRDKIQLVTVAGLMGGDLVRAAQFNFESIEFIPPILSTRADTLSAAKEIIAAGVDILIFVGGDGTARDLCAFMRAQCPSQLVLGVPAGVKMQSAVYAVNPAAAAELVGLMLGGELLNVHAAEVRDIDESALREGRVKSRHYGELCVPFDARFVQQVKQGGFIDDALVLLDMADYVKQQITHNTLCVFGPGSTIYTLQENLQLPATLLGFDVFLAGYIQGSDVTAAQLEQLISKHNGPIKIFITVIGGQGHIIGRGNQQLGAGLLRKLGKAAIIVLATKSKLASLQGRCLLMDSGDAQLDAQWRGYIPVICGYEDVVLYPLGDLAQVAEVELLH